MSEDKHPAPDLNQGAWLVFTFGYWGRGPTLREAAENCQKSGARRPDKASALYILGDNTPAITSAGFIEYAPGAMIIRAGLHKLGHLMDQRV